MRAGLRRLMAAASGAALLAASALASATPPAAPGALAAAAPLAVPGALVSTAPSAAPGAQEPPAAKVDPHVLADTADGRRASFIVLLAERADVRAAPAMRDRTARGWYVYGGLRDAAERGQRDLRALLTARGVPYQAYWVANAIVVTGDRALVDLLAARPDVRAIEPNHPVRGIEPPPPAGAAPAAPRDTASVEWGVSNVNAPSVWALGYTGQNIVVGVQDTGMQWDHPALRPHYRGWNGTTADHNYNWHDAIHSARPGNPCGSDAPAPCDDDASVGHGTHTTGTAVGDDGAGNQIGVAPGAKWIGCRTMDEGVGSPQTYMECFQFFLAPTDLAGNNPDPSRRPHVISNSWTCPPEEGCAPLTLQTTVESVQAAGIFVAAAAGNDGPGCSTVDQPPAIYAASLSVGAYDATNTLASFSSRGPVTVDGSGRLKPDLSAPGVNVRSAHPGNTYANLSGTSMAAPHVAGVVALLWSARPARVGDLAATRAALVGSANPALAVTPFQTCGGIGSGTIPNDSFGYGRVDALAALNDGATPTPSPTRTTTPTPSPAPTSTPTPAATPTPPACGTPPHIGVQAAPNGDGRLRVLVTASPGRTLTEISFPGDPHTAGNGRIDTATTTGQAPPLILPLPPGTTAYTFYVRRVTPGQATTLPFTVRDSCGALWPTLVGGGPTAF